VPEARRLQEELRARVEERDRLPRRVRLVAGVDVSCEWRGTRLHGAVMLLDAETGAIVETAGASLDARFPYVPGLLSFRELPVLLRAFAQLSRWPDLVLADAHGSPATSGSCSTPP
jgi:deoxyribonuclease V